MNREDQQTEEFLTQLVEHSRELHSTILRLVLNRGDADDIYQETCLVLWREFDQFQPGTSFRFWASRVAINQVLAWRKKRQRSRLAFRSEFLESVADEMVPQDGVDDRRSEALADCLARLSDRHRELIAARYGTSLDVPALAVKFRLTTNNLNRLLHRVRRKLFECIERKMKTR